MSARRTRESPQAQRRTAQEPTPAERSLAFLRQITQQPMATPQPARPLARNECDQLRLLRLLGKGAYGSVYEGCFGARCPRIYAAKVIKELDEPAAAAAFRHEAELAEAAGQLGVGPAVVARLVCPTKQGRSKHGYLVSEQWDGSLDKQPLWCTWNGSAIGDKLRRLLRKLHEHGIVHGDVAPRNVLFRRGNGQLELALADYGLSFRLDGDAAKQRTLDKWAQQLRREETLGRRERKALLAQWKADPTKLDAWLLERMLRQCK